MEKSSINKRFVNLIVVYCIWVGMCITIVVMLNREITANVLLGGYPSVASVVGIALASTFGFGVGGLGLVFSIIGAAGGDKKPEVAKGFGIANFVFILACLGTMVAGGILISIGFEENIECAQDPYLSPAWRENCATDIVYNIVNLACMLVIVGVSVGGIVTCVKLVSTINQMSPRTGFVSAPAASQATAAAPASTAGSKGKFCSACGASNESDAKFCKKCGAAC